MNDQTDAACVCVNIMVWVERPDCSIPAQHQQQQHDGDGGGGGGGDDDAPRTIKQRKWACGESHQSVHATQVARGGKSNATADKKR